LAPERPRLLTLEAARFVAALSVVLFHYTEVVVHFRNKLVFGDAFRAGHSGVPFFFVLSGFIIYHTHRTEIGSGAGAGRFLLKRFIRLFPAFWGVSLVMLAAFLLVPSLAEQRVLTPAGLAADFLLLPHSDAVLAISWTLRHEIIFYLLFALALWFGRPAFWLIGGWLAISLLGAAANLDRDALGSWSVIGSSLNLGFGLGMIIAATMDRPAIISPKLAVAAGLGLYAALAGVEWRLGHGVPHEVVVLGMAGSIGYLLAAAILIYGLVRYETEQRPPVPSLFGSLGGASYLLYLIHQPLGSVALRALRPLRTVSPELAFIVLVSAAVALALIVHLTLEQRLLRALTTWLAPRRRPTPAPALAAGAAQDEAAG